MNEDQLKNILEAVIYASDEPMSLNRLMSLFPEEGHPGRDAIKAAISQLQEEAADRSIELKEVGSGYRYQVRQNYAEWVSKLWEERPARYSRASLETLALIAYRQPVTRAEIEEVRGVSVSSNIIKAFIERDWVKIVGHRDVPGKPALYATTKGFLDYFNLASLENLPSLAEIRDIDSINEKLELSLPGENTAMAVDEDMPEAMDVDVNELVEPVNS
ncbi:MAG TPA: SMC-Scp complex subunit ScpB [Gammaproteobacteria bacterium]|nr:SMC-Scp complex subunit ScpB [Gammaproteobacteria bacterium]